MLKQSGVYRIELGNGRFYVGSSVDLRRRQAAHSTKLASGKHRNPIVQSSYDKHGVFEFTVLKLCSPDQVLVFEQALLDEHFNDPKCANIAPTAGNSLGIKRSAETRAKVAAANIGRKLSPEHRAKIGAAHRGRKRPPFTAEWRAKIGEASRNRPPASAETRAKIAAKGRGRKVSAETRAKLSAANKGRKRAPFTAEARANMSAALRNRGPISEETRAKLRAAALQQKVSAETRAKHSANAKAQWAKKRAANECCQLRLFNVS